MGERRTLANGRRDHTKPEHFAGTSRDNAPSRTGAFVRAREHRYLREISNSDAHVLHQECVWKCSRRLDILRGTAAIQPEKIWRCLRCDIGFGVVLSLGWTIYDPFWSGYWPHRRA